MSHKPVILFVLQQALGWRTYSNQLIAALKERDDAEILIHPLTHYRWRAIPYKRQHMRQYEKAYRHLDPIDGFAGPLGTKVREEIRRIRPDIVHFSAQYPAGTVFRMKDRPPYTVALDATRVNMEKQTEAGLWSQADLDREGELLRGAERLFPWSAWAGRSAVEDSDVTPEKVDVIFPSIDRSKAIARVPRKEGELPNVLFIGNDFLRKGGDKLHRWVTGPLAGKCNLHICSGDPVTQKLGGPNVIVHGRVPHDRLMSEILPQMDILCHPTQADMSAYVVIEASFAALPSLASGIGGIPELIIENETGWVRDRADEAGFIQTMQDLFAAPERMYDAGQKARLRAEAHFDARKNYNRMCDELIDLARARVPAQ